MFKQDLPSDIRHDILSKSNSKEPSNVIELDFPSQSNSSFMKLDEKDNENKKLLDNKTDEITFEKRDKEIIEVSQVDISLEEPTPVRLPSFYLDNCACKSTVLLVDNDSQTIEAL